MASSSTSRCMRAFSTLTDYQRNARQVPRMEHHVLSAAVYQAGIDRVKERELWKAYQKQAIKLKSSLTLRDCRLLAQGFIEPELRWRIFTPLFSTVADQLKGLLGQAKSLKKDLCLCVNSFAKVSVTDPGLFSAVGDVIVNKEGADLNYIDYGALTNAFARCNRPHVRLCTFICALDLHWGPTALGATLTALANLRFRPAEAFLQRSISILCEEASQYNAQDMSGAVFGLQRLLASSLPQEILDAIEPVILRDDYFTGNTISLAYFCASLEPTHVSSPVRDMILHTSRRELSALSSSRLSMILRVLEAPLPDEFCEQIHQLASGASWKELCVFTRSGNAATWNCILARALALTNVPDANSLSWILLKGSRDPRTAQLASIIPKVTWTAPAAHRALEALASLRLKDDAAIHTLMQIADNNNALARLGYPANASNYLVSALQVESMVDLEANATDSACVAYHQALGRVPPGGIKVLDEPLARGSGFLRDVHSALRRVGLVPKVLQPYGAFVAEIVTSCPANKLADSNPASTVRVRATAWLLETPKCFFLGTREVTPMQLLKRRALRHRWNIVSVPYWEWPHEHAEQRTYISSKMPF